MIFYFSGTGNSRYAARLIADETGDEAVSVNDILRRGGSGAYRSAQPLVFVCPTYAWRLPRVFERFLLDSRFEGNTKAYFVLTCGDHAGNAARYAQRLCRKNSFVFMGLNAVVMPENYTALFEVPDKAQACDILSRAEPVLRRIGALIKSETPLTTDRVTPAGRFLSTAVNPLFYAVIVSARGFRTTGACNGCGRCVSLCPLNNVTLKGGRPDWGTDCTHCMACINACPAGAVEYKKASTGKPRHYLQDGPDQPRH
jgi:ferredoxin